MMQTNSHQVQMGRAVSIIAAHFAAEHIAHADVDAFGAPSECHALVARGEAQRERQARRLAKAASGLSRAEFNRRLRKLDRRWIDAAVDRILVRDCPFD